MTLLEYTTQPAIPAHLSFEERLEMIQKMRIKAGGVKLTKDEVIINRHPAVKSRVTIFVKHYQCAYVVYRDDSILYTINGDRATCFSLNFNPFGK